MGFCVTRKNVKCVKKAREMTRHLEEKRGELERQWKVNAERSSGTLSTTASFQLDFV